MNLRTTQGEAGLAPPLAASYRIGRALLLLLLMYATVVPLRAASYQPLSNPPVAALQLENLNPKLKVVAQAPSGRLIAQPEYQPMLVSDDQGKNWSKSDPDGGFSLRSLALAGGGKILWSSSGGKSGRIFRSEDEGRSWKLELAVAGFSPYAIATNAGGSEAWIAGPGGRVIHTVAGSHTFDETMQLQQQAVITRLLVLDAGIVIAAGKNGLLAIKRAPNAAIELPWCGFNADFLSQAYDPVSRRIWFGGKDGVLCSSGDQGKSWTGSHPFDDTAEIYSMLYLPLKHSLLISSENSWVGLLNVGTGQWEEIPSRLLEELIYASARMEDGSILLAGANGVVYKGHPNTRDWQVARPGFDLMARSIATSRNGEHVFVVGDKGALRVSLDLGKTWVQQQAEDKTYFQAVVCDADGSAAYAVGSDGRIYQWNGASRRWRQGLKPGIHDELRAVWLSANGQILLVADMAGRMFSSDKTLTAWRRVPLPSAGGGITRIVSNRDDSMLAALVEDGGLLVSTDQGKTWRASRLPSTSVKRAIAIAGKRIWVAPPGNQLKYSDDMGAYWSTEATLPDPVRSVDILSQDQLLWFIGPSLVMYSADKGDTVSSVLPDPATYGYAAGSVASATGQLWIATTGGEVIHATPTGKFFPRVIRYILPDKLTDRDNLAEFVFDGGLACGAEPLALSAYIGSRHSSLKGLTLRTRWLARDKAEVRFDLPDDLPTGPLTLHFHTFCGGIFNQSYVFPDLQVLPWYDSIPGGPSTLVALATAIMLPLLMLAIYFIKPLILLNLQDLADPTALPPPFNYIVRYVFRYLLVGYLYKKPRVLDAWVAKILPQFEERWKQKAFAKQFEKYISLPLTLKDGGASARAAGEYGANDFHDVLPASATCVQMVGVGGVGKTMQSSAMAHWLLGGRLLGHRALPLVFDDGVPSSFENLKSALRSMLDDTVLGDGFIEALLRRRRIVPIFDRVSEQSDAVKATIRTTFRDMPALRLCLLTTRNILPMDVHIVELRPQAIVTATALTHFIEAIIPRHDERRRFAGMAERTFLAAELAKILQPEAGDLVLPLLASMFVEMILKGVGNAPVAMVLPRTTTELYLKYFHIMSMSGAEPQLKYHAAVAAGGALGYLAVFPSYAPRPIWYEAAVASLSDKGVGPATAMIDQLVLAGVLLSDERLGQTALNFSIDMLAQVLAAYHLFKMNGVGEEWWLQLQAEIGRQGDHGIEFLPIAEMVRNSLIARN